MSRQFCKFKTVGEHVQYARANNRMVVARRLGHTEWGCDGLDESIRDLHMTWARELRDELTNHPGTQPDLFVGLRA